MLCLGIDVGGTHISAGVVNDNNLIVGRSNIKIKVPCTHREMRSQILDAAKTAMKDYNVTWKDISSIGVGFPGVVDTEKGKVLFSSNLFIEDFNAGEMINEIIDIPVHIDNDANAAAYGEYICGALKDSKNAMGITLGTGIGCGIIIDGKLYGGEHNAAGEIGHMVIDPNGRLCNCGRKGCWERYASASGLIQTTREYLIEHPQDNKAMMTMLSGNISNITGETVFEAKEKGYPLSAEIVDIYINQLACGLANVINMFDPDTVSIGGGLSRVGLELLQPLKYNVYHEQFNSNHKETEIVLAKLGNDAGILGAANLSKTHLEND